MAPTSGNVLDQVQTMAALGAAFRATVAGIRHALIARTDIKREFRIDQTLVQARGNNPLKFSADDDDALTLDLVAQRKCVEITHRRPVLGRCQHMGFQHFYARY